LLEDNAGCKFIRIFANELLETNVWSTDKFRRRQWIMDGLECKPLPGKNTGLTPCLEGL